MKRRLIRAYQDSLSAVHQVQVYVRFSIMKCARQEERRKIGHAPVIVSMTSQSGRFRACYWAVLSLITQDQGRTPVHLWLQKKDRHLVPRRLARLERHGLVIHYLAEDYGPATKLLPSLAAWPSALIITADDDAVYERSWLSGLVAGHREHPGAIICYRTHRIRYTPTGAVSPYSTWEQMTPIDGFDNYHFFTGVGGVLYPPNSLHPEVLDIQQLRLLSIRADDIWFNWMARKQGTPIFRVPGKPNRWTPVLGSRDSGLFQENTEMGGNDAILRAIELHQSHPYP